MSLNHQIYQMKEMFLTGIVAATMVLFAFTSCQSKDEKMVLEKTKSEHQAVTYQKALKFFGINRTDLAEEMAQYIEQKTDYQVINQSIKSDKTIFTVKMTSYSSDEIYQSLQLMAQNSEQFDFNKINFSKAIQLIEKNEGRPLAMSESFIKVVMKNNLKKELFFESENQLTQPQQQLSQQIKSKQNRSPASLKSN